MKLKQDIRETAELHWEYTKKIIDKTIRITEPPPTEEFMESFLELLHVLYVEALVHGYKHKEDEING